jgi:hypothetical protein
MCAKTHSSANSCEPQFGPIVAIPGLGTASAALAALAAYRNLSRDWTGRTGRRSSEMTAPLPRRASFSTAYDPRGDGCASVVALADALPDKQDAALGGFADVLPKLRVGLTIATTDEPTGDVWAVGGVVWFMTR